MKMRSSPIKLEIAAHSLFSALQAEMGGADRIELCQALPTGGLTPSIGCMQMVRDQVSIPIHMLIRPRLGDFEYIDEEIDTMCASIAHCRKLGIEGVVLGCLEGDHLDQDSLTILCAEAEGLDLTFHRAFDLVNKPKEVIHELLQFGFDRILTSGQSASAWDGRSLLKELNEQYGEQIEVMPGAGISHENIAQLYQVTGCRAYHSSAKRQIRSAAVDDQLEITKINGQSIPKFETDAGQVHLMRQILNEI